MDSWLSRNATGTKPACQKKKDMLCSITTECLSIDLEKFLTYEEALKSISERIKDDIFPIRHRLTATVKTQDKLTAYDYTEFNKDPGLLFYSKTKKMMEDNLKPIIKELFFETRFKGVKFYINVVRVDRNTENTKVIPYTWYM